MKDDILEDVRNKLLKEHTSSLLKVPKKLTETYGKVGGWSGFLAGAGTGAMWGAHIGIATGGTAFAATVPLAIIGGVMGYFGGEKIGDQFKK